MLLDRELDRLRGWRKDSGRGYILTPKLLCDPHHMDDLENCPACLPPIDLGFSLLYGWRTVPAPSDKCLRTLKVPAHFLLLSHTLEFILGIDKTLVLACGNQGLVSAMQCVER